MEVNRILLEHPVRWVDRRDVTRVLGRETLPLNVLKVDRIDRR